MLYKFQDNLDFLATFANEIGAVFELKDGTNFFEETFDVWTGKIQEKQAMQTNDFEDTVYKVLCPEIRVNLTRIKSRALEYLLKIVKIVKVNFADHIKLNCAKMLPPIDPFYFLDILYNNTNSSKLKAKSAELCFSISECDFYGNNVFRSQKILSELINPPTTKPKKPNVFNVDDEDGAEQISNSSKDKESSKSDSDTDDSQSNMDLDAGGGQITDKIALIQEWLFSDPLPNFSKNDVIIEYLTDDTSLELFFKFIVSPFKSMIHHIV